MADSKITLKFEKEKETKNTVRYKEVSENGAPPVMGTTYLQKDSLGVLNNPAAISVEITAA